MNTYYELIQHIKNTFEEDERVNNVVTGGHEEYAKDLFNLVRMNVISAPFVSENNTSLVRFIIDVEVLDVRDVNPEDFKDRFWKNDNRHDIWNETLSILNLARNKFIKDHLRNDITLVTATDAEPITYAYMSGVDGWEQTLTIDVPDNFTAVC